MGIISILISCMLITLPVIAAETYTENERGTYEGYDFELWMDKGEGDASMTLNRAGAFSCEWTDANNVLFRTGRKFDETKTHEELGNISLEYGCDYKPAGNSYLCVYGWSVDPLVEFYIVESWGDWRPPGDQEKVKKSITVDGATYDVYQTERVNQPSVKGTQTFPQYWSVRTSRNTEGTVSVTDHIKAWEELGMTLGNMYEVAFCVEGYQSSGTADLHTNKLTIGDELVGAEYMSTETAQGSADDSEEVNSQLESGEDSNDSNESNESSEADSKENSRDSGMLLYTLIGAGAVIILGIILLILRGRRKKNSSQ
jgi:hypothetical protein